MNPSEMASALTSTAYNRIVQLRDEIREAIASKGLRASGRTQDSLRVYVDGNKVVLEGRAFFPALQYGSSAWTGKTGISCSYQEFKRIIYQWATDKGLNLGQAREFDKAVGSIAWSIMNNGTKLHRQGGRLDVYDTLINEALLDIGEQIQLVQAKAIDVVIDKWAKS